MKTQLFLIALLLLTAGVYSQSATDRADAIRQVLEHPDLQPYYSVSADGKTEPIYIVQYPTRFPAEVMERVDPQLAVFVENDDLPPNAGAWLRFRRFSFGENRASGTINLFHNDPGTGKQQVLNIQVEVEKVRSEWQVTNLNMGGF